MSRLSSERGQRYMAATLTLKWKALDLNPQASSLTAEALRESVCIRTSMLGGGMLGGSALEGLAPADASKGKTMHSARVGSGYFPERAQSWMPRASSIE